MLGIFLAVALASPSPTPTPALKTIVTVRASAFCGAFAAHINSAITSAVGNDQSLGDTIAALRSGDLAGSTIARQNEMHRLEDLANVIYRRYRSGETEVNELRDLASKATDPDEKLAVTQAANALGGALYRQHLVQRDLQGFLSFLDASDMMSDFTDKAGTVSPAEMGYQQQPDDPYKPANSTYWFPSTVFYPHPQSMSLVGHESPDDDVQMAQAASDEFRQRMLPIFQDEMNASTRIATAGTACMSNEK